MVPGQKYKSVHKGGVTWGGLKPGVPQDPPVQADPAQVFA